MTADPEIKTIGENRLCEFTIACERPKRKGEETAETDFFPCTAWNRNADVIVDWFGKGDMVTLVGSVHNKRYEKDGQKRSAIEVKVEEIHFNGGKKRENTAPTDTGYDNPYAKTEDDPLF
jgi:single-strand binding protein